MEFVEEYLRDVVCQRFPFSDKEKNKLTFEVMHDEMVCVFLCFALFVLFWGRHFCVVFFFDGVNRKYFSVVILSWYSGFVIKKAFV